MNGEFIKIVDICDGNKCPPQKNGMCADIGQIAFVIFTMLMNFFVLYCINIATQFVSGDDAFEKHDKSILKSVGGPTLVIIIVCCVLVRQAAYGTWYCMMQRLNLKMLTFDDRDEDA